MCLDTIREEYETPSEVVVDGWKTFNARSGDLFSQQTGDKIVLDKWLQAKESPVHMGGKSYTSGFHIFMDEEQAKKKGYRRRVYARKITILGTQEGIECVIAKEMYVPSDPDGWPPKPGESTPPSTSKLDHLKQRLTGSQGNA